MQRQLRHIQDAARDYRSELEAAENQQAKRDKLCEINVIEQVRNAGQTTVMQDAWQRGQEISIHRLDLPPQRRNFSGLERNAR